MHYPYDVMLLFILASHCLLQKARLDTHRLLEAMLQDGWEIKSEKYAKFFPLDIKDNVRTSCACL